MQITIESSGGANDAQTINSAITNVAAAGGGTVTLLAGTYNVTSQIVVFNSVKIVGEGGTRFVVGSPGTIAGGSIINVNWGNGVGTSGILNYAAVVLQAGAGISNVAFNYPAQISILSAPIEYGSTVQLGDLTNGNLDQSVVDCTFFKSYIAIDARGSKGNNLGVGGLNISNCRGAPLQCGIAVDFVADWCTIQNCQFNSGDVDPINPNNPLSSWTAQNGYAIYAGGNDWLTFNNIKIWGYGAGAYVNAGANYVGTGPYVFSGCEFDACWSGIILEGTFNQIVRILGCNFTSFRHTDNARGAAVSVFPGINTANGGLQFVSNYVFGPSNNVIWAAQSSQTFSNVVVTNNISEVTSFGDAGIAIVGGNNIQITGNILRGFNSPISMLSCTNVINEWNQN